MADFHQTGVISTLHRLGPPDLNRLERELVSYSDERPTALVLPSLYSEVRGPALKGIVEQLQHVPYLCQIVVSLSGPSERAQYEDMRQLFKEVRTIDGEQPMVVWNQGPRVIALIEQLREEGLDPGVDGKGRATWLAYGYVLATHKARVVALHDCDILDYQREMLARLVYPTANPNLNYEFAKGYYGRVTDQLHGRVSRLFMTPLLRSMKSVLGVQPLLEYLDSFRYPLAGECSMTTDLVRANRIPSDWGLEVGVLAEVYRNCSLKRICQVDLVDNYDHKHQDLSENDSTRGLHRMVRDIAASLIRNLASYGVEFDAGFLNTMIAAYVRTAQDAIARYSDDAALNGLRFDRHAEEVAVETFSSALRAAGLDFVRDPMGAPQIPNWSRVVSALPGFLDQLREAVDDDAADGADLS
jgi:glucosyl-3-phosphoglycerate synthase